jgi:hypothetical protein
MILSRKLTPLFLPVWKRLATIYSSDIITQKMKRDNNTSEWSPDLKITWGASLLIVVLTNFFIIFFESIGTVDLESKGWWVGLAIGSALSAIINWLRPRYDKAGRFWKPIYRFLLEQMHPPD